MKKHLKKVEEWLFSQKYILTDTWRIDEKRGYASCYIRKYKTYYLVTISTCTGLLLVEIFKSHVTHRIDDPSVV